MDDAGAMPDCDVCGGPGHRFAGYDRRLDPDGPTPPKWTGLLICLCRECAVPGDELPPGWAYDEAP